MHLVHISGKCFAVLVVCTTVIIFVFLSGCRNLTETAQIFYGKAQPDLSSASAFDITVVASSI